MIVRNHIVFQGRVQGVGFRFRAKHAADLMGATGWVRNEPDGSVTMEIQGTPEQIKRVIEMTGEGTYVNIEEIDSKEIGTDPSERSFEYRFR